MAIKEVQIIRREVKSHLPVPVISSSIKILASVFDGQGPLRGVTGDEETRLMSTLLGMDPADRDFHAKVREFWIDLRVKVPVDGVPLKIGLREDGTPYNVKDYLIYKWALKHKRVAHTKAEMDNNSQKLFYIHDPEVETKQQNMEVKMRKTAYMEFSKLDRKIDKMKMLLKVLDDVNVDNMTDVDIENRLEDVLNKDPKAFVDKATDKHLETEAFIVDLISKNILRKIGNSIYYIEEKLGGDMEETILYLADNKNSEMLMILKEKLQEVKR